MTFDEWWRLAEGTYTTAQEQAARDAWDAATRSAERRVCEALDHAAALEHGAHRSKWASNFKRRALVALGLL